MSIQESQHIPKIPEENLGDLVMTLTAKDGQAYQLYRRDKTEYDLPFDVQFDLIDPRTKNRAGRIAIWKEQFYAPKLPQNFLEMPPELFALPFYRSEVTVFPAFQGQGLGSQLSEQLLLWFQNQPDELVHFDFFTTEGLKYLGKIFMDNGYQVARITDEFLASQFTGTEQKVWIYKKYSHEK